MRILFGVSFAAVVEGAACAAGAAVVVPGAALAFATFRRRCSRLALLFNGGAEIFCEAPIAADVAEDVAENVAEDVAEDVAEVD